MYASQATQKGNLHSVKYDHALLLDNCKGSLIFKKVFSL